MQTDGEYVRLWQETAEALGEFHGYVSAARNVAYSSFTGPAQRKPLLLEDLQTATASEWFGRAAETMEYRHRLSASDWLLHPVRSGVISQEAKAYRSVPAGELRKVRDRAREAKRTDFVNLLQMMRDHGYAQLRMMDARSEGLAAPEPPQEIRPVKNVIDACMAAWEKYRPPPYNADPLERIACGVWDIIDACFGMFREQRKPA